MLLEFQQILVIEDFEVAPLASETITRSGTIEPPHNAFRKTVRTDQGFQTIRLSNHLVHSRWELQVQSRDRMASKNVHIMRVIPHTIDQNIEYEERQCFQTQSVPIYLGSSRLALNDDGAATARMVPSSRDRTLLAS